jgi:hypothetical protein
MAPDLLLDPSVALGALSALLFGVVAIGHLVAGPARFVKLATLGLVGSFGGLLVAQTGLERGLLALGAVVGLPLPGIAAALTTWRHPERKELRPATEADCPAHARKRLERYTRELETAGFRVHADRQTSFSFQNQPRTTFVRFFRHHDEPFWFEIHALSAPRVVARAVVSERDDGLDVMTCDQQSDPEVLGGGGPSQRVPRRTSCLDMIDRHRRLASTTDARLRGADDPAAAHVRLYDGWVQRMLRAGGLTRRDAGLVGVRGGAIPGVMLRVYRAWLH